MFSIILFLILIIISGSIAYMGDKLGTVMGKAKISFFGLRPKHTARFVAILSGMVITATTISVIAIFTEEGRILLAGAEKIKKELRANEAEIKSQQENLQALNMGKIKLDEMVSELESQRDTLAKQIDDYKHISSNLANVREKKVAYNVNELIISKNTDKADSNNPGRTGKSIVDNILMDLNISLSKKKTGFWTGTQQRFYLPDTEYNKFTNAVSGAQTPLKIRIIAKSNVFEGEFVPVKIEYEAVSKLFDKNYIIYTAQVDSSTGENTLIKYLQDTKNLMIQKGLQIEPNEQPYIDLNNFYTVSKEIKSLGAGNSARLEIYASDNIYSKGPATVSMRVVR